MKQAGKILSTIIFVFLIVAVLLLAAPRLFGIRLYSVLSGSMEPAYYTGDLIYVFPTDEKDLRRGDVISFLLNSQGTVATHRIIEIDDENRCVYTKGDANNVGDGSPVKFENVIGVVRFSIPKIGFLIEYMNTQTGRIIVITILGALILLVLLLQRVGEAEAKKQEEEKRKQAQYEKTLKQDLKTKQKNLEQIQRQQQFEEQKKQLEQEMLLFQQEMERSKLAEEQNARASVVRPQPQPIAAAPVQNPYYAEQPAAATPTQTPYYAEQPAAATPAQTPYYAEQPAAATPAQTPYYAEQPAAATPAQTPYYAEPENTAADDDDTQSIKLQLLRFDKGKWYYERSRRYHIKYPNADHILRQWDKKAVIREQ